MADIQAGKPLITLLKPGGITPGPTTTPITIDGSLGSLSGNVQNGVPIDVNLVDSLGNLVPNGTILQTGNVFDAEIVDVTPFSVNGTPVSNIKNWNNVDIQLLDQFSNPIVPTSVSIASNVITINENVPPTPSGVALKVPPPSQYTIYATGATPEDEGWRWQNGWWNYVAPSSPEKVADLDYSVLTPDYWYVLKYPLRVGSVVSNIRFVDVLGGQAWSNANNTDYVTIDKLTGLMFVRLYSVYSLSANWQNTINNIAALSIVVNGVTYNDWYVPSISEAMALFGTFRTSGNWTDPLTGNHIIANVGVSTWPTGNYWTSTTREDLTSAACVSRADLTYGMNGANSVAKTTNLPCVAIRDARNLIFAS